MNMIVGHRMEILYQGENCQIHRIIMNLNLQKMDLIFMLLMIMLMTYSLIKLDNCYIL